MYRQTSTTTKSQEKDILDHDLRVIRSASCRVDDLKTSTFHGLSLSSSDRDARLGLSIFYAGAWRGSDAYAANHMEIQIAQEEGQLSDALIRQMASSRMRMGTHYPELVIQVQNFHHELCFLFGKQSIVAHRINQFIHWMQNSDMPIRSLIKHHGNEFCMCFLDKLDRGVQKYLTACMSAAEHDHAGEETPVSDRVLSYHFLRDAVMEEFFTPHNVPELIRNELMPNNDQHPPRRLQQQQPPRNQQQHQQNQRQQQQRQPQRQNQNGIQPNRTNVTNPDMDLRLGDMGKFKQLMKVPNKPRLHDGDVCMNYHFLTRCPAGPTCPRHLAHRRLNQNEKDKLRKFMEDNLDN